MAGEPDNQVDLIRQYLADRTIGCPVCHYNLRGAPVNSCPECGTPLEIHLSSNQSSLWPWLLNPIAIALPLGFTATLVMLGLFGAWQSYAWRDDDWIALVGSGVVSLFYLAMLRRAVRRRAKFMQLPRREQWTRAFVHAAGIMIIHAVYLIVLVQFVPW